MHAPWWHQAGTCERLSDWFTSHLVLLHIPFEQDGERKHELCSGFDLDVGFARLWVTAGHVIDLIREMVLDETVKIGNPRWLDNHSNPQVSGMPMTLTNRVMYSAMPRGDWGCILLSDIEGASLDQNPAHKRLTPVVWSNPKGEVPEAHFVCGAPRSTANFTYVSSDERSTTGRTHAVTPCIPLRQVSEDEAHRAFRGWAKEPSRYFEVVSVATPSGGWRLSSTQGMSGSPVFAASKEEGGIRYRLVGVQAAQSKDAKMIRAVDVEALILEMRSAWPALPATT